MNIVNDSAAESEGAPKKEIKVALNLTVWEKQFIANFVESEGSICPFYHLRRFCRRFRNNDSWIECQDELRQEFNNEEILKEFRRKVKPIISEVAARLKHSGLQKKTIRYISFGIGAGGHDIKKSFLACSDDMKLFRLYSQKHNFYLGSSVEEGTVPCFAAVKERIKYACICAWECNSSLVLYYTGHGFGKNGNWSFYDGEMSFDTLLAVINEAKQDFGLDEVPPVAKTFVVCDSCCSGHWCKFNDSHITVIASCGAEECTYGDFARVFFKAKLRLTDSEIQRFKVGKLQIEIQRHVGGAIDHSLKTDLCNRLQDLETDQSNKIIDGVMKDEPCVTGQHQGDFRLLTELEVVHKLWFKNKKKDDIIPELTDLTI